LSVEREEGPGGEERDPGPIMRMATGKPPEQWGSPDSGVSD
jgi:hypothetical protein